MQGIAKQYPVVVEARNVLILNHNNLSHVGWEFL